MALRFYFQGESPIENFVIHLQERVSLFLCHISSTSAESIRALLFEDQRLNDMFWASSVLTLLNVEPYKDSEHGLVLIHNDLTKNLNTDTNICSYLNVLQV